MFILIRKITTSCINMYLSLMHHLVILKFCHSRTSIEMLATQADKYRLTIFKIIKLLMFEMGSEVGCLLGIWRSHDCQKNMETETTNSKFVQ